MKNNITPISLNTFSLFSNFIKETIKRKENGTIIGLSHREKSYRINQFIDSSDNISIKLIDLKNSLFEDPEDFIFEKKFIYLISNADVILDEKKELLSFFNEITKKQNSPIFIFFFQKNITYPWISIKISSYNYLFQNIFFYPKYNNNDLKQFLFYLENKFKISLSLKIKRLILEKCGGSLWLIKEAVRYYSKTKDIKKIFNHEEMILRLRIIYQELDDEEKKILKKLVKKETNFSPEEELIKNYLEKTNFISPLLMEYIASTNNCENNILLNSKEEIIVNNINVNYFFSKNERKGLRFLIKNKGKLIMREELADTIWLSEEKYSDWALDQFIKRLRNKLFKLGLNRNLIKTKKNQGFIFSLNN